ncbi:MAG TPA: PEP-CTERM system histidine kinase PrsK, partial [Rubrivivax sp.]|nr:PEP-CTERM system histidine kinase PrsK [Rubrivivax sp.]
MTADTAEIAIFGFAAATLVHAVFAALLLRDPGFGTDNRLASRAFIGAVLASVAWAAAGLADQFSPFLVTRHLVMGLDWVRYGLWLLFLGALVWPQFGVKFGVRSCL